MSQRVCFIKHVTTVAPCGEPPAHCLQQRNQITQIISAALETEKARPPLEKKNKIKNKNQHSFPESRHVN